LSEDHVWEDHAQNLEDDLRDDDRGDHVKQEDPEESLWVTLEHANGPQWRAGVPAFHLDVDDHVDQYSQGRQATQLESQYLAISIDTCLLIILD